MLRVGCAPRGEFARELFIIGDFLIFRDIRITVREDRENELTGNESDF